MRTLNINQLAVLSGFDFQYPTVEEKAHLDWHDVVDGESPPEFDQTKNIIFHTRLTDDETAPHYGFLMGPIKVSSLLPIWNFKHTGKDNDVIRWAYDE